MGPRHLETELIAYLDGSLAGEARARVETHLEGCAACRATLDDFRGLLTRLSSDAPEPPAVSWHRYRADLRARREARQGLWPWAFRPLQAALSVGLVAVLAILAAQPAGVRPLANGGTVALEIASGVRLDVIRTYSVLEQLDLLEDLDLIVQLDRLAAGNKG